MLLDADKRSGQMFNSYSDADNENTSHLRWIIIVICAGVLVIGGMVGAYRFTYRHDPNYMASRLHRGMSEEDVIKKIGPPSVHNGFSGVIYDCGSGKLCRDEEWDSDENNGSLSIRFWNGRQNLIKEWCYRSKCHDLE